MLLLGQSLRWVMQVAILEFKEDACLLKALQVVKTEKS